MFSSARGLITYCCNIETCLYANATSSALTLYRPHQGWCRRLGFTCRFINVTCPCEHLRVIVVALAKTVSVDMVVAAILSSIQKIRVGFSKAYASIATRYVRPCTRARSTHRSHVLYNVVAILL